MAAVASMETDRVAMTHEPGSRLDDFGTRMRKKVDPKAESFDAAQAVARNELALDFCKRRGVQSTFRAAYSRHTAEVVGVLVRGWCRKMQIYFDLEITSPEGTKLVFGDGHHSAFHEATEFSELAESNPGNEVMRRVRQIRAIFR